MSIGLTPKTLRLPKKGEMLLSVRGSPLGVFKEKEDNMEAINGMHFMVFHLVVHKFILPLKFID